MASTDWKIKKLGKNVTLQVTLHFTKQFKMRIWAGQTLLKLAAWVMGCGIEITQSSD